jgi:energy-converting hydrogenase A subunit D
MIEAAWYEIVLVAIALAGAFSVWHWKDQYEKLIGLAIITAGVLPFIVIAGFLDVAIAVALIMPIATIIVLRLEEVEEDD